MSDEPVVADPEPAQPAEDLPDTEPPSEPTTEPAPSDAPPAEGDDEPKDLKDLRAKYPHFKGDDKALLAFAAERYWDQTRELSRLSKDREELESLRGRVRELEGAKPPTGKEEPPAEEPAEVKELDQRITRLTSKAEQITQQQAQRVKALSELDTDIKKLQGELGSTYTPEHEKEGLKARIDLLETKYATRYEQWLAANDRLEEIAEARSATAREREWTKRLLEQAEASQQREQEESRAEAQDLVSKIPSITKATADAVKFPLDPGLRELLGDYVASKVTLDFRRAGNTRVTEEMVKELVKTHVKSFAAKHGLQARTAFTEASKAKAAVAGRPGGPPIPPAHKTGELSQMQKARRYFESKQSW